MADAITLDPEFETIRRKWYSNDAILFELVKNLVHRETAFIRQPIENEKGVAIRCIKANALVYLSKNFERFKFLSTPCNLYASLAKYPNMPMFSFNMKTRGEQREKFNIDYMSMMVSYDLLIDIDNTDMKIAYAHTYKVKKILDDYKVSYTAIYSGSKGFHLRVYYEDFPQWIKDLSKPELIDLLKRLGENIRFINNISSLDIGIFDSRRIAKVPYSIVYPYYLVALPLSDDQFNNFKIEMVSPVYWLDHAQEIYKRGNLKREGTSGGFDKLVRDYTR